MTRFMICDTDVEFLQKLAGVLHQLYDPCTVEYMYGPSALEASLAADAGGADILITEIELRSKSAIDIIERNLKPSSPLQIIYMTPKMDYCTEVYRTRHCGFLMKPVQKQMLKRDIARATKLLEMRKEHGIVIQKNSSIYVVDMLSLLYVESQGRTIRVYTDSEVLETYDKIANLNYRLDRRFLQCHKSYLINMERVQKYCGDKFIMSNGAEIPISQSKRKEVRAKFLEYMGDAAK